MGSIIRVLDDHTINQIAAGEVIENPASVVKELVENALDAKADVITVEIKGGGRQLIRVSDNGCGMSKDDAILCFERHATSKVSEISDLEKLLTMGFRGEALASIASVSKVRLMTKQKEGTLVEMAGGKLLNVTSVPCEVGTTLEISDLFFNAPARKKFMKSPAQDAQEIHKHLIALALANPTIEFKFISDGELVLKAAKGTLEERANEILFSDLKDNLKPFSFESDYLKIKGLLGWPSVHRPNRSSQYLFINRRPVTSWLISQAVTEGYGSALPERRFPLFVLQFELSGKELDVNVHPQKKEVRFRQESYLKECVRNAVAGAWNLQTPKMETKVNPSNISFDTVSYSPSFSSPFLIREPVEPSYPLPLPIVPRIIGILPQYLLLEYSPLHPEEKGGLCLVDIQRARARVLYEGFLKQKEMQGKQALLIPYSVEVSSLESRLIEKHVKELALLGFEVRAFGEKTWLIDTLPDGFEEGDIIDFIHTFLGSLEEKNTVDTQKMAKTSAELLSRNKRLLSQGEGESLIHELLQCQQPYFSPSGEKVTLWISQEQMRALFK